MSASDKKHCNEPKRSENALVDTASAVIQSSSISKDEDKSMEEKDHKKSETITDSHLPIKVDSEKFALPKAPRRVTRSMTQQDFGNKRTKRTQKASQNTTPSNSTKEGTCDKSSKATTSRKKKTYSAPTSSDTTPVAPKQLTPTYAFRPISPVKQLVDAQFKNLPVTAVAPQARRILQTDSSNFFQESAEEIFEKTKIANVPLLMVRLGSWKHQSHFCGELVASFNFHEKVLTWEIFLPPLIYRVEVPFSSVSGLGFLSSEESASILILELSTAPNLLVAQFAPHAALVWRPTNDFTGGHIKLITRHALIAPKGSFNQALEHMLKTEERLAQIASKGLEPHFNRYFARENPIRPAPRVDLESGLGDSSDVESSGAKTEDGDDHEPLSDCAKHIFAKLPPDVLAQAFHRWDTGCFLCPCGESIPWRKLLSHRNCICGLTWFYSFCSDCVAPVDALWHCHECGACRDSNTKHCGQCNSCTTQKDGTCSVCSFLCTDSLQSLPIHFQNLGMQNHMEAAKNNNFINPRQLHPDGCHAFNAYEPDTK